MSSSNSSGLEKIVSNEPSSKTWLAKKLNNPNKGFIGKTLDYLVGAAATTFSYSLIGVPALVAAGVSIVGDYVGNIWRGKKTPSAQIRDSLMFSSVIAPLGYGFLSFLNANININAPYGILKRTLAQFALAQGIGAPIGSHLDYMLRHKTLDIKSAFEKQFKPFYLSNAFWSTLGSIAPISLAKLGFGVDEQFYGGLASAVAVKGLAYGRQIAYSNPYGQYSPNPAH